MKWDTRLVWAGNLFMERTRNCLLQKILTAQIRGSCILEGVTKGGVSNCSGVEQNCN